MEKQYLNEIEKNRKCIDSVFENLGMKKRKEK